MSRLTHAQALQRVNAVGISVHSSGNCSDRNRPNCTSLDTILAKTIDQIVAFKRKSGKVVIITGGTETGHASGTKSHWNGYKLDIAMNAGVTDYITKNFRYIGTTNGGRWAQYQDGSDIWTNEGNHWDIVIS
ncbi:hypothetical protein RvY_14254 [Ramazzottius varieornatus]|uniref:Tardigrade-unique protein with predicted mitochondria targeting peptide 5 n=1 Tax=Ramazzottius varieornatus TaxID=947166 RepID=A0A0E4AVP5_RAMVA|nr:tardigrade-unique protein with predicted mitochondria targeting peptide 5 [Ramazzottius varieornatus]GAV03885.1 hypothetical protein RvY_14254 [Ramazzottius varieornatus]